MTILADELKVLRQRALLTQEEFAKTLSVAPSTVNRWEMSKAKPNVSTMKKIKTFCADNDLSYAEVEAGWISYSKEGKHD